MIRELSYLPVWYADPEDFVFTEEIASPRFFSLQPKELRPFAKLISRKEIKQQKDNLPEMQAAPWGLSPHSHSLLKTPEERQPEPYDPGMERRIHTVDKPSDSSRVSG